MKLIHLISLLFSGIDSLTYDPQRFAYDYSILGFRECAAEVARYLVTIEGMDIQDPLRLRLMSHLQCFVAQRELSAKTNAHQSWSPGNYQTPIAYQTVQPPPPPHPPSTVSYHHNYPPQTSSSSNSYVPNISSPLIPIECCSTTNRTQTTNTLSHSQNISHEMHHPSPHHHYQTEGEVQENAVYTDISSNTHRSASAAVANYNNSQFPPLNAQAYPPHDGVPGGAYNGSTMKPYRPWGAEMAY